MRATSLSTRERGFVSQLVTFVVVSALAGVLVAGLLIPFAGMAGLTTRSVTDSFESMNGQLPTPPLPERSKMLAADGSTLATFYDENRVYVGIDDISKVMRDAVIAIEDSRFYEHGALDARGTLRAFVRNSQTGAVSQGGSTITQQYVKLVQFENAQTPEERRKVIEDSYGRKLQELRYAVELEKTWSKDRILENYLNIVYFGDGAYGVQSAARHFFRKHAKDLTLSEAAMLAGLVRDPVGLDVTKKPKPVLARRNLVLERMADAGTITPAAASRAMEDPLGLQITKSRRGCYYSKYPFFCDYAEQVLLKDPALGKNTEERRRFLYQGGLTIKTTLDPKAQKAAQDAVSASVGRGDSAVGAISMVEPGTGYVKAMAQSRPFGKGWGRTYVNYNVERKYNGGLGYQPGSTFKPFVLAAALKKGVPLTNRLPSPSSMTIDERIPTCNGSWGDDKPWTIFNSTSASGSSDLISGTVRSVNTFYVNLERQIGLCEPYKVATKLGVTRGDGENLLQVGSFVLGVNEVTPLSMAEAYATFAARGVHCNATGVTEIVDRKGNQVGAPGADCKQAISREVADGVNFVLRQVIDGSDPGRTGSRMHLEGRQAAGKTGTNNSRLAVSFAGYTSNLAAFAVVADAHKSLRSLIGQQIGGRYVGSNEVWGGRLAGPIWTAAMEGALSGVKSPDFSEPNPDTIRGVPTDVPNVVEMSPGRAEAVLKEAGFNIATGGWTDSPLPRGTIARQNPGGGSQAGSGSTVTIYLSDGTPYVPPKPSPKPDPTKPPGPRPTEPPPDDGGGGGGGGDIGGGDSGPG